MIKINKKINRRFQYDHLCKYVASVNIDIDLNLNANEELGVDVIRDARCDVNVDVKADVVVNDVNTKSELSILYLPLLPTYQ